MAYKELGRFVEMAALQAATLVLDVAEVLEGLFGTGGRRGEHTSRHSVSLTDG